jgi:hypothetical protein
MKYAPLAAGGALLLLMLGIAAGKPVTTASKQVALDMTGVDTLEVVSDKGLVAIRISSGKPAGMSYQDLKTSKVTATRLNNRMRIESNIDYPQIELVVPPGVTTFLVRSAAISSKLPLESVTVRASSSLSWDADVRELRVEQSSPRVACTCACGLSVEVSDGEISRLQVSGPDTDVSLNKPDKVAAAYLDLGPGDVSLHAAGRLDNIHLRPRSADDALAAAAAILAQKRDRNCAAREAAASADF